MSGRAPRLVSAPPLPPLTTPHHREATWWRGALGQSRSGVGGGWTVVLLFGILGIFGKLDWIGVAVSKRRRENAGNEESMSCGRVDSGRPGGGSRRGRREGKQGQGLGGRVEISAEVGAVSRSGEVMAPSAYR